MKAKKGRIPRVLGRPGGKEEGWPPDTPQYGSRDGQTMLLSSETGYQSESVAGILRFESVELRELRCYDYRVSSNGSFSAPV